MRCDDVKELILIPARPDDVTPARSDTSSISDHIQTCGVCSIFARSMEKVDLHLRKVVRCAPPVDLQANLIAQALEHAAAVRMSNTPVETAPLFAPGSTARRGSMAAVDVFAGERLQQLVLPASSPKYQGTGLFETRFWAVVAAFGLFAAAALQIAGWFAAIPIEVGDIVEGVSILAASPASQYLGDLGINLPSLAIWSAIGIALWIAMRMGLIDQPSGEPA